MLPAFGVRSILPEPLLLWGASSELPDFLPRSLIPQHVANPSPPQPGHGQPAADVRGYPRAHGLGVRSRNGQVGCNLHVGNILRRKSKILQGAIAFDSQVSSQILKCVCIISCPVISHLQLSVTSSCSLSAIDSSVARLTPFSIHVFCVLFRWVVNLISSPSAPRTSDRPSQSSSRRATSAPPVLPLPSPCPGLRFDRALRHSAAQLGNSFSLLNTFSESLAVLRSSICVLLCRRGRTF